MLGSAERLLTDDQGTVDILADLLIDLDADLQVSWVWNPFDHLDVTHGAVLDEQCTVITPGCPPLKKAFRADDWTHANTIDYLPDDGNLLISLRNLDWVIKVDYRDGAGTGAVLWRLGPGGDFRLEPDDERLWFSHQHDAHMEAGELLLFDNGNTRCVDQDDSCHSRGQALRIDEETRTAEVVLSVDLGAFSAFYGSAQRLSSGNYHFLCGILPGFRSRSVEFRPDGTRTFALEAESVSQYRSFRLSDLYTGPVPGGSPPSHGGTIYLPLAAR